MQRTGYGVVSCQLCRRRKEEVFTQWYGPEHVFFKVGTDDGNVYILRHQTSVPDGEWDLVSFRGHARNR
jgi:hypothetical protein